MTLKTAFRSGIEQRELKPNGRVGGFGEGRVDSWTGSVATFEVGGEIITRSVLRIDDNKHADRDMLVGLDYFLSHRIYVSRLQGKFYATWNGSPVFRLSEWDAGKADTHDAALPQEVGKDDADALARRGSAAIATGYFMHALADLNRACELAPGVADYFYTRGRLHLEMEKPEMALADFNRALQLDPNLTEVRIRRAGLLVAKADLTGAKADLTQLDATLPPSSNLRSAMARLFVKLEMTDEALRQYGLWVSAHRADAHLAGVLNSRCWLRVTHNIDLALALQDCKESIDIDAGSSASRDSLGWTYLRLGDAAKAKIAFDGAINIQPIASSLYGRGLAQMRLKELAAGQSDIAAALKLNPKIEEDLRKDGLAFQEQ